MTTAPKSPYSDFVAQAWEEDAMHHSQKKHVYEAVTYNGKEKCPVSGAVLEFDTDAEAIAWIEEYQKKWPAEIVELYRVPFVNETHMSSRDLWPDDVHLLKVFPCKPQ